MAATKMKVDGVVVAIVLLILNADMVTTTNDVKEQLTKLFGSNIQGKAETFSGYLVLEERYQQVGKNKSDVVIMQVQGRNGTELISGMANDLRKMIKRKHNAVRRMVDALESHSKNFNWNYIRSAEAVEYPFFNAEYLNKQPADIDMIDGEDHYTTQRKTLKLTPDNRFLNRPVNFDRSVAQVPFDVYSRRADIMRAANWTKILDDKFKKNLEKDPSIKWQYFGTTDGLLRFYPPFQWKMLTQTGKPNVYDCRMRSWYTKAATFPKDMVILVDFSGSMDGLNMWVATHIVQALLDTLGDNDFFNILTYSNEVQYVESCFNGTLVRADGGNKGRLMESLKHLQPQGVAKLGLALEVAFNLTLKFHSEGVGSGCYSSIVIITDGVTDTYQDIMDQYNNKTDRQIRIFSYLVGSDTSYMEYVRDIACNNNGLFQRVLSRNDIKEKVLHYLTVMNRPQAVKEDHHTVWTKPYYDQTFLDLGFGLVSTVAVPAYIHRSSNGSRTLGGVAATDVPIDHMLNAMPIHRAGVNGYVFILTNNGYVAAHPRLNTFFTRVHHLGEMSVKPNYNSIDIDDLEGAAVNDTIRAAILARSVGRSDVRSVTIPLDNGTRFIRVQGRYYYSAVDQQNTPFHVATFLPNSYGEWKVELSKTFKIRKYDHPSIDQCPQINRSLPYVYPVDDEVTVDILACSLLANNSIFLPNSWSYCHPRNESTLNSADGGKMSQLELIKTYLFQQKKSNVSIECDLEMINLVLLDVYVTSSLERFWNDRLGSGKPDDSDGAIAVFVITSSGVMRKRWQSQYCEEYKQSILNLLTGFDRQSFPSFYRRTVAYPDASAYLFTPIPTAYKRTDILVSKAIRHENGTVHGVSGVVIDGEYFTDSFWNDVNSSTCSRDSNGYYTCYVIDENGIVAISNTASWKDDVTKSIASVDGQVTKFFVDVGIFAVVSLYDRTYVCRMDKPVEPDSLHSGSLSATINPFASAIGYLSFWTTEFASLIAKLTVTNVWTFLATIKTSEGTYKARENGRTIHYDLCDVRYKVLSVNNQRLPFDSSAGCSANCTRSISIQQIKGSNLFLIIAENLANLGCDCSAQMKPFPMKKEEILYSKEEICRKLKDHKSGRKADGCDTHHRIKTQIKDEHSQECSSSFSIHSTRRRILTPLISFSRFLHVYFSGIACFVPFLSAVMLSATDHQIQSVLSV